MKGNSRLVRSSVLSSGCRYVVAVFSRRDCYLSRAIQVLEVPCDVLIEPVHLPVLAVRCYRQERQREGNPIVLPHVEDYARLAKAAHKAHGQRYKPWEALELCISGGLVPNEELLLVRVKGALVAPPPIVVPFTSPSMQLDLPWESMSSAG